MAKRILIVDDEPRYLRLLEANLRTEGYFQSTDRPCVDGCDDAEAGWFWRHATHP
jgi:DNA-binding response OmpR family regulator